VACYRMQTGKIRPIAGVRDYHPIFWRDASMKNVLQPCLSFMRHVITVMLAASFTTAYAQSSTPSNDQILEAACLARPTTACLAQMKASCVQAGGKWEGHIIGRGRLWGCNLPTKDGGKVCKTSSDCESACVPMDSSSPSSACACSGRKMQPKGALSLCTANGIETLMVD